MKDIVIKGSSVKREWWILFACYVITNIVNAVVINHYSTSWTELYTMQGYIVIASFVVYFLSSIIRLIIKLFTPKKKRI